MSQLQVPVYNESIPYCKYLRMLEKYKIQKSEEKYNLILTILNDWLKLDKDTRLTELTQFKDMDKSDLLLNNSGYTILVKYQEKIKNIFELDLNLNIKKKEYIFFVLKKLLANIDYTLSSKEGELDTLLYTIYKKRCI